MKYELTNSDGIECSFILKNDEVVKCFIPTSKIIELIEDEAYETVTKTECNSSSCAVNNFCECDPINEDAHLEYISVSVSQEKDLLIDFRNFVNEDERMHLYLPEEIIHRYIESIDK